jgi:hypothetical protein
VPAHHLRVDEAVLHREEEAGQTGQCRRRW